MNYTVCKHVHLCCFRTLRVKEAVPDPRGLAGGGLLLMLSICHSVSSCKELHNQTLGEQHRGGRCNRCPLSSILELMAHILTPSATLRQWNDGCNWYKPLPLKLNWFFLKCVVDMHIGKSIKKWQKGDKMERKIRWCLRRRTGEVVRRKIPKNPQFGCIFFFHFFYLFLCLNLCT